MPNDVINVACRLRTMLLSDHAQPMIRTSVLLVMSLAAAASASDDIDSVSTSSHLR